VHAAAVCAHAAQVQLAQLIAQGWFGSFGGGGEEAHRGFVSGRTRLNLKGESWHEREKQS
jgi:hypothetical protein